MTPLRASGLGAQLYKGGATTPVGLEGKILNQRGLFSRLMISWNLPCKVLDLLGTHHSFLLSYFFLLEWQHLCLSRHCNLEAHNLPGFTGSQLERICPRMNCTSSLPYIRFSSLLSLKHWFHHDLLLSYGDHSEGNPIHLQVAVLVFGKYVLIYCH